jgi:hypothetical protein
MVAWDFERIKKSSERRKKKEWKSERMTLGWRRKKLIDRISTSEGDEYFKILDECLKFVFRTTKKHVIEKELQCFGFSVEEIRIINGFYD